jgi:hypothetical protein
MAGFARRMIGAAKLDVEIYEEVEADGTATPQAMAVVVLSSLAAGLGSYQHVGLLGLVSVTVSALVAWFVWAGLIWFIGSKLLPEPQTRVDMADMLRTIGFSASPGILRILGLIPLIGWFISLAASVWMLVAMVVAARQALDYRSTGRAVVVCAIGFIVYLVIVSAIALFAAGVRAVGLGH